MYIRFLCLGIKVSPLRNIVFCVSVRVVFFSRIINSSSSVLFLLWLGLVLWLGVMLFCVFSICVEQCLSYNSCAPSVNNAYRIECSQSGTTTSAGNIKLWQADTRCSGCAEGSNYNNMQI